LQPITPMLCKTNFIQSPVLFMAARGVKGLFRVYLMQKRAGRLRRQPFLPKCIHKSRPTMTLIAARVANLAHPTHRSIANKSLPQRAAFHYTHNYSVCALMHTPLPTRSFSLPRDFLIYFLRWEAELRWNLYSMLGLFLHILCPSNPSLLNWIYAVCKLVAFL
jgi:hypothetical protein